MHYELLIDLCNEQMRKIIATYYYLIAADIEELLIQYNINEKHLPNEDELSQHMHSLFNILTIDMQLNESDKRL